MKTITAYAITALKSTCALGCRTADDSELLNGLITWASLNNFSWSSP